MRLHRFNVVQPLGEEVVIDEVSLVNQWTKVLRYGVGDFVVLYNGDGTEYSYEIQTVSRNAYTLSLQETSPSYIPTKKSYLYLAIIKKDAFEVASKMATETGITDIIPLISSRTEQKPLDVRRLSLITKEASEQSGRGDMPVLHGAIMLDTLFASTESFAIDSKRVFVATRHGVPLQKILSSPVTHNEPVAFVVGPEGGWTEEEEGLFTARKCTRVSLGNTVLRAETAGAVCSFLSTLV